MEEVKYIQGDLVKLDGRLKVIIRPEISDFRVRDIETNLITLCTIESVKPIKLTPAILKANGWLKIEDKFYTGYQSPKDWRLQLQIVEDRFVAYLHDELLYAINSIAQLQHLLFGLGLNSELKV